MRWIFHEIIGGGTGINWPDVVEVINVEGMLHGVPAPRVPVKKAP